MKFKISIIIPVFNVEDYIKEALESIISQTIGFEHLEVIMINDGSTDSSGIIMDKYASKYKNFIAIHLPDNSGFAGKPRNVGIEKATGEYIMFLDPDDYYTYDACEILYKKIKNENADIVFGKFKILFENGKIIDASSWYPVYPENIDEIKKIKTNNKELLYHSPPSIMTKIFKHDFIKKNDIISPEGVPGEDLAFATHCFLKTDEIIYINKDVLIIRKRETKNKSVTFNINAEYIHGSIHAFKHIDQICLESGKEEEFPLIMEKRFPFFFNQLIISNLSTYEKKEALKSATPILKKYYNSNLDFPNHLVPALESIINKKFDNAILLLNQIKHLQEFQKSNNKSNIIKKDNSEDISIIIVTKNNEKTIKRTILAILNTIFKDRIDMVIIDNNSNDDTIPLIEKLRKYYDINLIKLDNYSDLSRIRNMAIENSKGKYIIFLDFRFKLNIANLFKMFDYANLNNLDCIKGYVKIASDNKIKYNINNSGNNDRLDTINNIMEKNNIILDILIKKEFLTKNNINFNKNYNLNIENIFYADLFSCWPKIEYYNSYVYELSDIKNLSTTKRYTNNILNDKIDSLELIGKKLQKIGIDYYKISLKTEIKNILYSIIFHSNGISEGTFNRLSAFLNVNINYIKDLMLHERQELILNSIIDNDYGKFISLSKKRLLIVGHDLKFIEPSLRYLKNDYNIKIDKWADENSHNEKKSLELLNWADYIFCEWLLGNAEWYSNRKLDYQKLIIRAHRFELSRDYGNKTDFQNVNGVIAISYYLLELFSNIFTIPRQKMILLSNYVETDIYDGLKSEDFKQNIAIVGYIPRLKGLLKGLKILKMLKEEDYNFKLFLIGKHYKEVHWVWSNPKERSYFETCEKFIKENNLEDSVIFKGWTARSKIFNNIGYVLSVSDIEGSHQAPSEGLADSTLALLLNWDGAEYIYPQEILFNDINDIKNTIISTYNDDYEYRELLKKMRNYVVNEFNLKKFAMNLKQTLEKIED